MLAVRVRHVAGPSRAVLGFMALLAILVLFSRRSRSRPRTSSVAHPPGFVVAVAGSLFCKLVRVLSRIQMPKYPGT